MTAIALSRHLCWLLFDLRRNTYKPELNHSLMLE